MDRQLTAALLTPGLACGPAGADAETDVCGALPGRRRDIDLHALQGDHRSVAFCDPVC